MMTNSHRRKFRFLTRFSIRTFLVVVVVLAIVIAPLAQKTRHQMYLCERLEKAGIEYALGSVPPWMRWLPESWLNALGGHWCRPIDRVSMSYQWQYRNGQNSDDENRDLIKTNLKLLGGVPKETSVDVKLDYLEGDLTQLKDVLAPLADVKHLRLLQYEGENCDVVLEALPAQPSLIALDLGTSYETKVDLTKVLKFSNRELVFLP